MAHIVTQQRGCDPQETRNESLLGFLFSSLISASPFWFHFLPAIPHADEDVDPSSPMITYFPLFICPSLDSKPQGNT